MAALAGELVQAPVGAPGLVEVAVKAVGVAAVAESQCRSKLDNLPARPGRPARTAGRSKKEKEVWWLPCYSSSSLGLVMTQP